MGEKIKKDFWSEEAGKWYVDSCRFLDYPRIPLGDTFKEIICPQDSVLDLGCAFGLTSLYLAQHCRVCYALDESERAIGWLSDYVVKNNIQNVIPVCGGFPAEKVPVCDVSVVLYVNMLVYNAAQAKKLLDATGREGILLITHVNDNECIQDKALKLLGMWTERSGCRNGCYIIGLFEALGARCDCKIIHHDFGQPVGDYEEAARFLRYMLHFGEDMLPELRKIAPLMVENKNGSLYLPNNRKSCLIHFKK